jgi:hypothetical protein
VEDESRGSVCECVGVKEEKREEEKSVCVWAEEKRRVCV